MADSTFGEKGLPSETRLAARPNLFDGTFPLPTAVLIEAALQHNIDLMSRYCTSHAVLLAPHGKTTMSKEIILRQVAAGAWAITAATAWQAKAIAAMGVQRIVVANELVDRGSIGLIDEMLRTAGAPEISCYVDSDEGFDLLCEHLPPDSLARLGLLVELGVQGGRTGLRSDSQALSLARRIAAEHAQLHGFAAFEGIIDGGSLDMTVTLVDRLIDRLQHVALAARVEGLYMNDKPVVTVGGSAYFDRVVRRLPETLAGFQVVLRSGCYVSHDSGSYARLSPLDGRSTGGDRLRPALEVWAAVLSRPEAGRAILGLGRRDISSDAGLPIPVWARSRAGVLRAASSSWKAVAINDQHLHLELPSEAELAVGDLVGFGNSHPCTTFDKWRAIPMVDGGYTVTGMANPRF